MTTPKDIYAPPFEADVTRLVVEHPLAWVITAAQGEFSATLLPLRPVLAADGSIDYLRGHFSRSNPHAAVARRVPRTLLLFTGPHGYVSPSWMTDRTQAPTWNYASVQYVADLEFVDDTPRMDELMRDLVGAMEAGRPKAWSIDDMGARYGKLSQRIVGFHARIVERRAKFKLGQDERDDVYAEITGQLADQELLEWMRKANPGR